MSEGTSKKFKKTFRGFLKGRVSKVHTTGENFDFVSLVMRETNEMLDCYISLQ